MAAGWLPVLSQEGWVAPEPHGQDFLHGVTDTVAPLSWHQHLSFDILWFLRGVSEGNMVQGTPPPCGKREPA